MGDFGSSGSFGGSAAGDGVGYDEVQDEGSPLAKERAIDFQGAGVTATAGAGKTIVTIPGGGGGGETELGSGGNGALQGPVTESAAAPDASGSLATALGEGCTASGDRSLAAGNSSTAGAANDTTALGQTAVASTTGSVALGHDATAGTGVCNVAIGDNVNATGSGGECVAIGRNAGCTGAGGSNIAIGHGASTTQNSSVAIGESAMATGASFSVALGPSANITSGSSTSVAIGFDATTSAANTICLNASGGERNNSKASTCYISEALLSHRYVEDNTSNQTLVGEASGSDLGGIFTNTGDADAIVYTLPAAVKGLQYDFMKVADFNFAIDANGAETIRLASTDTTNAVVENTTSERAYIRLICVETGEWLAFDDMGTWALVATPT